MRMIKQRGSLHVPRRALLASPKETRKGGASTVSLLTPSFNHLCKRIATVNKKRQHTDLTSSNLPSQKMQAMEPQG